MIESLAGKRVTQLVTLHGMAQEVNEHTDVFMDFDRRVVIVTHTKSGNGAVTVIPFEGVGFINMVDD